MIVRTIVHTLSNNVVMTKLSTGKNSIAFGKGIGFKKKPGMTVSEEDITREFLLQTSEVIEHYEQVLETVDFKIVGITEEIIALAQEKLVGSFSETIHATLVDHINFAIDRIKRGVVITNPFAFEIKHLYREEYEAATEAVHYLNSHLDVVLPEDEIAFLAMHFHGARNHEKGTESLSVVRLVAQIIDESKQMGLQFDDSFSTLRFISHLKAFMDRIKHQKTIHNPLLDRIKLEYASAYRKAENIAMVIEKQLNMNIPEDEIGFLALHIERLNQRHLTS